MEQKAVCSAGAPGDIVIYLVSQRGLNAAFWQRAK